MRDFRINLIFEGSSEIMHLFMAREAVDKHLQVAGDLIDPETRDGREAGGAPGAAAFYAWWYPTRWLGWGRWPRYREFGALARHLRFVERSARKLAREIFHGMVRFQAKLQNKQGFLFRLVDVANELFAMAATVCRAEALRRGAAPESAEAAELADLFCRISRRRVKQLFRDLWDNDDAVRYRTAVGVLEGRQHWLERGALELPTPPRVEGPAGVAM